MDKEAAIEIARKHIVQLNEENPYADKIKWIVPEPVEVKKGWYFDYEFELINPDEPFDMAGAPGFLIAKGSMDAEIVSWAAYKELRSKI